MITSVENYFEIIEHLDIPEFSKETNFWLVRTESGKLYDIFLKNKFVALGWNEILSKEVKEASDTEEKKSKILNYIKEEYNTKVPGAVFNKIKRFIFDINNNDILIIPDKFNNQLTFAYALDYYEEENHLISESEFDALRGDGWDEIINIKGCPYTKRRSIKIIKTIEKKDIPINLYPALISHHGISNLNKYSVDVLMCIYKIFIYNKSIYNVFKVQKEDKIDAINYSKFIYNSSKILELNEDVKSINVTSNINSPGYIVLSISLLPTIDKITSFIKDRFFHIWLTWIFVSGGKLKSEKLGISLEITPLLKRISEYLDDKVTREGKRIDNDLKKEKVKEEKLKNLKRELELKEYIYKNREIFESIEDSSKKLVIEELDIDQFIDVNNT